MKREIAGADFEDPGEWVGLEVGGAGLNGGHLSVVVGGEQHEVVPGVAGVVVDGGEQDRPVVVEQDPGEPVLLVLYAACGFVEQVECQFEFVIHGGFRSVW